uniref:U3 small nucleolar ribonucleoprotein protein MPP10 n=1 Tax=Lepeophtheirus salmonis TaxID=72036 RepID=A0A0K2UEK6_LEPSM
MDGILEDTLLHFNEVTKKPVRYLKKDQSLFSELKQSVKALYDGVKAFEEESLQEDDNSTLDKLIADEFDEEQIWAGVQLQNGFKLDKWIKEITGIKLGVQLGKRASVLLGDEVPLKRKALEDSLSEDDTSDESGTTKTPRVKKVSFSIEDEVSFDESDDEDEDDQEAEISEDPDISESEEDDIPNEDVKDDEESEIFYDPDFQNMSDSDGDDLPLFENVETDDEDEEKEDDSVEETEAEKRTREMDTKANEYLANAMKNIKTRSSEVDDEFFKLSEMEQFLEMEDKRFTDQKTGKYDEKSHHPVDMFEENEEDAMKENNQIMYSDYFQNESISHENEVLKASGMKERKVLKQDDSENKPLNIFEYDDDSSDNEATNKSSHEQRQERLKKKIEKLENAAIKEKEWQMTGEASATSRPENSLLQDHLDFDTVAKQAPIITEEVSKTLEQLILQRIKDKSWDDVERKVKPVKDPYEYKKKLMLDQEKSKFSLAEIYEKEYLQQQGKLSQEKEKVSILDKDDMEIPKEVEDIQKRMNSLFAKLDVLTHYHYVPKTLSAEIKVIKNKSTLQMEEVAPIGVSEETLLAPQEIADKSKNCEIGKDERTDTDKKRERRKKKHVQKLKAERQEKLVQNINPGLGNKYAKEKALKTLKDAEKKGHNVKILSNDSSSVKSSSSFFDKLQNEVKKGIESKKTSSRSVSKNKKKSSQFKL